MAQFCSMQMLAIAIQRTVQNFHILLKFLIPLKEICLIDYTNSNAEEVETFEPRKKSMNLVLVLFYERSGLKVSWNKLINFDYRFFCFIFVIHHYTTFNMLRPNKHSNNCVQGDDHNFK